MTEVFAIGDRLQRLDLQLLEQISDVLPVIRMLAEHPVGQRRGSRAEPFTIGIADRQRSPSPRHPCEHVLTV